MDSLECLEELKDVMATIELVKNRFPPADTKGIADASSTLQILIQALQRRKQKEMETLMTALSTSTTTTNYTPVSDPGLTSDYSTIETTLAELSDAPIFANSWTFDELDWMSSLAPLGQ